MFNMKELTGSLDEYHRTLQSDNNNNSNNNIAENDVFDDLTQLVADTTTSDGNVGPMVGYPMEWTSSFGDERGVGVGGSIAERRAVTCGFEGFSGPDINIARFKSICPLSSSPVGVSSSHYITIPVGISPTELLDSPVMLRYSQAQPSPTTGSFQLSPLNRESVTLDCITPSIDQEKENYVGSSCMSRLHESTAAFISGSSMGNKEFGLPVEFSNHVENSNLELLADFEDSKDRIDDLTAQSKSSEDGYNWRKYGQKQVKGSEFPRSYYKCTHPSCLVKKKVERSLDGDVAEIIYKGSHNHPPPQPNLCLIGSLYLDNVGVNEPCSEEREEREEREEGGIVWRNIQPKKDQSENLDTFPTAHMKPSGGYEVTGGEASSSKLVIHHEDDGKPLENNACLNEPESKRRKIDNPFPESSGASRGVREPRVVVQIESEVDILDDGYRWRKYGQKVVKGNPNPRSYYKCTSLACPVRKHVERACDDFKFVITAYEGKHNHDVPVAKSAATSSTALSPSTSTHPNGMKTEPQNYYIPDLGNDVMRSALYGNLNTDMYPLHFPHLQNPMGYNSYSGMPNFPMSFLYDVPRPPLMMPDDVNPYNVRPPVQSSVVIQQPTENELGLITKPKQERM